jgi:hypothetical protein
MLYVLINGNLYKNIPVDDDNNNIYNCLKCSLKSKIEFDSDNPKILCKYNDLVCKCVDNKLGILKICEEEEIVMNEGDRILNLGEF